MRLFKREWNRVAQYITYNLKGFSLAFSMIASNSQRKHFREWLYSHRKGYLLDRPMPWIVYDAYDYLDKIVPANIRVFEYGSGGSTLYWLTCKRSQCISIEHNPNWYELVNKYVLNLGAPSDVDYRLVEPIAYKSDGLDVYDPANYLDDKMRNFSFENYVKQIDEFPDEYFDVVMIDGEARPSCIVHGWKKVRRGGLMIVDNADRSDYFKHIPEIIEAFEEHSFRGVVPSAMVMARTNIYRRL